MSENIKVSSNKRTIAAALANYIDAGSIVAGSAGLTLWVHHLGLSETQIGLLGALSANAISAAIGALLGGFLADRLGRKLIYTVSMLIYSLGILFILFSSNFGMLLTGFIIVGIAVGADITASWTIIAENAPKENRARHCGVAQVAWGLGAAVVLLLSVLLGNLGLLGNKIVFGHLLVIALITFIMRKRLPESDEWVTSNQSSENVASAKVSYLDLFQPKFLKTIGFLLGVYLMWNLAAGVMGFFMPYIYEQVGGVSSTVANLLQMGLFIIVALSVAFIFMPFADKYRKSVYAFSAFMAMIAWSLFLLPIEGISVLVLFMIVMGINTGSGQQANYQLWSSELFPTKYRASAQGLMFFIVRICIGIWSLFVPIIMESQGFQFVATILLILVTISFFIGTFFAPKTSGKSLEQIEKELYGTNNIKTQLKSKVL
jgi:MFS transporter, SP family, inositol transporter